MRESEERAGSWDHVYFSCAVDNMFIQMPPLLVSGCKKSIHVKKHEKLLGQIHTDAVTSHLCPYCSEGSVPTLWAAGASLEDLQPVTGWPRNWCHGDIGLIGFGQ